MDCEINMSNLKCPFCQYVWTPRVSQPRTCTRCKRTFYYGQEGRFPLPTDEPVVRQKVIVPDVKKYDSVKLFCELCGGLSDTIIAYKSKRLCLTCFVSSVTKEKGKAEVPVEMEKFIARPEKFTFTEASHE